MSYFTEQREKQMNVDNVYIAPNEKQSLVIKMAEKAKLLAERHLLFVNAKNVPSEISDWHEQRAKLNNEISARLIGYLRIL